MLDLSSAPAYGTAAAAVSVIVCHHFRHRSLSRYLKFVQAMALVNPPTAADTAERLMRVYPQAPTVSSSLPMSVLKDAAALEKPKVLPTRRRKLEAAPEPGP